MRPQGRAHAGFYPLPLGAVKTALLHLFAEHPEGVNALDPCVGDGVAFKALLEGLEIPMGNANAVELTINRGEEATKRLEGANVLAPADFLNGVTRPARSFSFVYCNSPYDDETGGGYRVETSFADKVAHLLRIDGVALFVVPEHTWTSNRDFRLSIAKNFVEVLAVYPEAEDRPYNETLVFGVRRDNLNTDWCGSPIMQFKADEDEPYMIPTLKNPCWSLKKTSMTEIEMKTCLINSPIEKIVDVPEPITRGRPPLALGEGHNGMLVASGQAPPIVTMRDAKERMIEIPHLVRGVSTKVPYLKEEVDDVDAAGESYRKEVWAEAFLLTMTVLLHTGEVIKLKQGSAETAAKQEEERKATRKLQMPGVEQERSLDVLPGSQTHRNSHGGIAV